MRLLLPGLSSGVTHPLFLSNCCAAEEGKGALALSMQAADEQGANVILANDPDADRLAVAERIPQHLLKSGLLCAGSRHTLVVCVFLFFCCQLRLTERRTRFLSFFLSASQVPLTLVTSGVFSRGMKLVRCSGTGSGRTTNTARVKVGFIGRTFHRVLRSNAMPACVDLLFGCQ